MKVNKYDAIASLYLLLIVVLSILKVHLNFGILGIYFLISVFLINSMEHMLGICTLSSMIAYFFVGADEGLYSIYTIFSCLLFFKMILEQDLKIRKKTKNLVFKIIIIILASFSYANSPFKYTNGLFLLAYIVVFSMIIGNLMVIDYHKFLRVLVFLTCEMVYCYMVMICLDGVYNEGRMRFSAEINANTCGMATAQLGIILFLANLCGKEYGIKKNFIWVTFCLDVILVLLSGSRNALMALFFAIGVVLFVLVNRRGQLNSVAKRMIIIGGAMLFILIIGLNFMGVDMDRYNYIELLQGGGTNRFTIYIKVIPFILAMGYWRLGYGPGHECSHIVVTRLCGRDYAHTHNLFIESFAELGIAGLFLTIYIVKNSICNVLELSKHNDEMIILFGMLIGLIVNGMGESYFADIYFWTLLGLCDNQLSD